MQNSINSTYFYIYGLLTPAICKKIKKTNTHHKQVVPLPDGEVISEFLASKIKNKNIYPNNTYEKIFI